MVYLATEVETKKQLVCKVVDLKNLRGRNAPEELRRKLQEADVLRQLQHVRVARAGLTIIATAADGATAKYSALC